MGVASLVIVSPLPHGCFTKRKEKIDPDRSLIKNKQSPLKLSNLSMQEND